jgi:hypothetical protein
MASPKQVEANQGNRLGTEGDQGVGTTGFFDSAATAR